MKLAGIMAVYFSRITEALSSNKGSIIVAIWNGTNATILWIKSATEVVGLLSAIIALACGGFTLYGHIEKRWGKKGEDRQDQGSEVKR